MGESSACLVRSFSLSSPTSGEDKKGNSSMQRALTTSISFGRFVPESLDWEKWSAFTHNRHLEEVERYSKPGSVAEKRAYFEAHFKRRRAAALVEQQNVVVSNLPEINEKSSVGDKCSSSDLDSAQRDSYEKDGDIQNTDPVSSPVGQNETIDASSEINSETGPSGRFEEVSELPIAIKHDSNDASIKTKLDTGPSGELEEVSESPIAVENDSNDAGPSGELEEVLESPIAVANDSNDASIKTKLETGPSGVFEEVSELLIVMEKTQVELTKVPENDECIGDDIVSKKKDKACGEDDSNKRNLASFNEKKSKISSSSKLSTNSGVSKFAPPVKQIMPSKIRNSVKTPDSKNIATLNSSNKRRAYTTSLHTSINFASSSHKATSPGLSKVVANSRLVRAPEKKYKNSTLPQTLTRAPVSGVSKHHSAAPPAENRRIVIPQGDSKSVRKTVDWKVHPPVENRRTVTPQGDSNSVRKTMDWKVHHQSSDFSKSSNTFEGKSRLPTASSPFTFKSEERAAKRKEFFQKLEQKSKSKETDKHGQQAKSQVKARSSFKEIRNSVVSKATENAEAPPRKEVPSNLKKKIPTERRSFHKIEEVSSSKVQDKDDSRPPWSLSATKTKRSKLAAGTDLRTSAKCFPKKTNENASPNIQV